MNQHEEFLVSGELMAIHQFCGVGVGEVNEGEKRGSGLIWSGLRRTTLLDGALPVLFSRL